MLELRTLLAPFVRSNSSTTMTFSLSHCFRLVSLARVANLPSLRNPPTRFTPTIPLALPIGVRLPTRLTRSFSASPSSRRDYFAKRNRPASGTILSWFLHPIRPEFVPTPQTLRLPPKASITQGRKFSHYIFGSGRLAIFQPAKYRFSIFLPRYTSHCLRSSRFIHAVRKLSPVFAALYIFRLATRIFATDPVHLCHLERIGGHFDLFLADANFEHVFGRVEKVYGKTQSFIDLLQKVSQLISEGIVKEIFVISNA